MKKVKAGLAAFWMLLALGLNVTVLSVVTACSDDDCAERQLDDAGDATRDAVEDAGDKVEEATEE